MLVCLYFQEVHADPRLGVCGVHKHGSDHCCQSRRSRRQLQARPWIDSSRCQSWSRWQTGTAKFCVTKALTRTDDKSALCSYFDASSADTLGWGWSIPARLLDPSPVPGHHSPWASHMWSLESHSCIHDLFGLLHNSFDGTEVPPPTWRATFIPRWPRFYHNSLLLWCPLYVMMNLYCAPSGECLWHIQHCSNIKNIHHSCLKEGTRNHFVALVVKKG